MSHLFNGDGLNCSPLPLLLPESKGSFMGPVQMPPQGRKSIFWQEFVAGSFTSYWAVCVYVYVGAGGGGRGYCLCVCGGRCWFVDFRLLTCAELSHGSRIGNFLPLCPPQALPTAVIWAFRDTIPACTWARGTYSPVGGPHPHPTPRTQFWEN